MQEPERCRHVGSYNLVEGRTHKSGTLRMRTIIDAFTREFDLTGTPLNGGFVARPQGMADGPNLLLSAIALTATVIFWI